MWLQFKRNLPGIKFWLVNLAFWLLINSLATDNSYRTRVEYGKEADWWLIWLNYLPWWTMWALVAPLVIAASKQISFSERHPLDFVFKNVLLAGASLTLYWGLSIVGAMLIEMQSLDFASFEKVFTFWTLSLLHIDFLIYLAILCVGYTLAFYQLSKREAVRNEQLVAQLYETELQTLRSQINPHFLFNTLNSVTSLIRLDEKNGAIKALSELSKMLRKVLENQKSQWTTVEDEIAFIESYLSIQQLRFGQKLDVVIEADPHIQRAQMPFMLLQPLVENAVQHGSQLESDKNQLTLTLAQQQAHLVITLINKMCQHQQHEGFGIGLENCRSRLQKLYPGNFELTTEALNDGRYKTLVRIPMENEE